MANRSKIDMIGSEAELKPSSPADVRPDNSGIRGGTMDIVGSGAELSRRVTPMGNFDKGISGGTMQMTGSDALLSKTPSRGWQSHPTPISRNTENPDKGGSGF